MTAAEEELIPRPQALIESLRSFGYTPETSIADLIDNSISAGATSISVHFEWMGEDSFLTITDDGAGMNESELREAMRAGSADPLDGRSSGDLGRFGLGLKTASFAQARSLTVLSRRNGKTAVRRWDLDHVRRENRWSLLTSEREGPSLSGQILGRHGTVVAWHLLDRIVDDRSESDEKARSAFFATVDGVKEHLEMVFHRFIEEDGLVLRVNGIKCIPWDPFVEEQSPTKLHDESISFRHSDGSLATVKIQPFVLPHRSKMSVSQHQRAAGPRGWNLQQGFYLYRARRLIISGDWFNSGLKPEEHQKLARIRVEIDQELDGSWALDVKKARARPPADLRADFERIAKATRAQAESVYRSRGMNEIGLGRRSSKKTEPIWRVKTDGSTVEFELNRKHVFVAQLTSEVGQTERRWLESLFKLIERTLPVDRILSLGYSNEHQLERSEDDQNELRRMAMALFCAYVSDGLERDEASGAVLSQQPFDQDPVLAGLLKELDCNE